MARGFIIKGTLIKDVTALNLKSKPYKSKVFKTSEQASKYGWKKVYRSDGNTRRTRNVLTDFQILDA
jgi:hypothetical protein